MTHVEFALPDIGEGLAEAEIVEWLAAVGDAVEADQPVVTVETAKAQVTVPAPAAGRLISRPHEPGDVLAVGDTLFVIDAEVESASVAELLPPVNSVAPAYRVDDLVRPASVPSITDDTVERVSDEPMPSTAVSGAVSPRLPASATRRRVLAAPSTRKLALDHGVDLTGLLGSGPNGRVEADDVLGALRLGVEEKQTANRSGGFATPSTFMMSADDIEIRPLGGLRRQTARAMTATLSIPHVTDYREIDATVLLDARSALQAASAYKITLLPLLVRIVVVALRKHPIFNANYDSKAEELKLFTQPNIGIATMTPDGLLVPVLKAAGRYPVGELAQEMNRLTTAGRDRCLRPDDTTGATFTISNYGSFGSWLGTPLIVPPQVAIAGFGRARDAVVAENGVPVVRPVLPVAVAADHRVIDGADLGAFMNTLNNLIRNPLLLLGEA